MTSRGHEAVSAEPRGGSDVIDLTQLKKVGAKFAARPSWWGMATETGFPPGPERTRALLEQVAGSWRAEQLRGQVMSANRGATRDQLDEAFQEACAKATSRCDGQTLGAVYLWLLRTTESTLKDMRVHLKSEVLVDQAMTEFPTTDPSLAQPDEVVIRREEREEIDRLALAILERLDDRGRNVAVLHSNGVQRNDIAAHLGITPRVVKRDVESILTTGRLQLAKLVGCGCPEGHKLVSRYAFGLGSQRDAHRAQLHLTACGRCAQMYERLDGWRERVAALLPLPPAVDTKTHIVERIVHSGADALTSGHGPAGESPAELKRHLASATNHLREQASSWYYRTADPTPLAGVRPGAVAAAVAGCLAVGSGATYCVQQGTDSLTVLGGLGASAQHHREKAKPHKLRAHTAQAPATPVVTPTVTAPPQPAQQAPPPAPTTTTTVAPPAAPEDPFEPTSASVSSQTTNQSPTSKPKQPAPAPASGPSEFGGP
jgi:hypothetical protein